MNQGKGGKCDSKCRNGPASRSTTSQKENKTTERDPRIDRRHGETVGEKYTAYRGKQQSSEGKALAKWGDCVGGLHWPQNFKSSVSVLRSSRK
jgi:hypothetical protein